MSGTYWGWFRYGIGCSLISATLLRLTDSFGAFALACVVVVTGQVLMESVNE